MYPEEHSEQAVPDEHFVHPKGQALQTELSGQQPSSHFEHDDTEEQVKHGY